MYYLEKPSLISSSYRFQLNEDIESVIKDNEKILSQEILDLFNVKDNKGIYNETDWEKIYDLAKSDQERRAIVKIFLSDLCERQNINEKVFDDGFEVLFKLFDELGFKESNNPYISFIKVFYNLNNDTSLSQDDWIDLNDWYANDLIDASDLKGSGFDRKDHLIFNKNLYVDSSVSSHKDDYLEYYQTLSTSYGINELNLYAMATYNGSPYKDLVKFTKDGKDGTGKFQEGDFREVRNIIFFKNLSSPVKGGLHSYNEVNKAIELGKDIQSKASSDEKARGVSQRDLHRNIKNALKEIKAKYDKLKEQVKNIVKNDSNEQRVANKLIAQDETQLNKLVSNLQDSQTEGQYQDRLSKLNNYISYETKLGDYYKLNSSKPSNNSSPNNNVQMTYKDIEKAFNTLSNDDKQSLVKLLKDKGIIK